MLEIKNLSVNFNTKIVLKDASFRAEDNKLTVIMGKSGSGKSTFLQAFLFKYDCKYYYNDLEIMALNLEWRAKFFYDKVSFVYQTPLFINGMTIREHIDLIIKTYSIKENNDLVSQLDVSSLLNKYPRELSGGEKTRVGIMLALLKSPEIIILDEPTASLDHNNALKVIALLGQYARDGHIVIVASHDRNMIEAADCLYEIIDHKCVNRHESHPVLPKSSYNLEKRNNRHLKIKFGHKLFRFIMLILLSVSLVITIYGMNVYDSYGEAYEDKLANMSSLELLVYKQKYDNDYFSYDGDEYPFTKSEIEKIKKISHVKDVSWHFDKQFEVMVGDSDNEAIGVEDNEVMSKMSLFKGNEVIFKDEDIGSFSFHSYDDSKDYHDKLVYHFSNQGIIISNNLFRAIKAKTDFKIEQMEKLSLDFIVFIPKYDSSNTSQLWLDDEMTKWVDVNTVRGVYRHITLPIKGVLKENNSLYSVDVNENSIFVENSVLQSYIEKTYPDSVRVSYAVNQEDGTRSVYINALPEWVKDEDIIHVVTETPWQPNSYIIKVDKVTNIESVIDELIRLGYGIEANYVDSSAFSLLSNDNQNIMQSFIIAIFIVLFSFYIYLKYLIIRENQESKLFLKNLGLNNHEISFSFYYKYLVSAFVMFAVSSVLLFGSNELFAKIQVIQLIIRPRIIYFIYLLIMSMIVEFIIPAGLDIARHKLGK